MICLGRTYTNNRVFGRHTYVGTMRLLVLPPRYGDPFYRGRGRGSGRGRGRRELMGERPPERDST